MLVYSVRWGGAAGAKLPHLKGGSLMKMLVVFAIVAVLGLETVATVNAEETSTNGTTGLGQHVGTMAPEHAITMAPRAFGQCVSLMATTGVCPACDSLGYSGPPSRSPCSTA
jgi:hypothetical protein